MLRLSIFLIADWSERECVMTILRMCVFLLPLQGKMQLYLDLYVVRLGFGSSGRVIFSGGCK